MRFALMRKDVAKSRLRKDRMRRTLRCHHGPINTPISSPENLKKTNSSNLHAELALIRVKWNGSCYIAASALLSVSKITKQWRILKVAKGERFRRPEYFVRQATARLGLHCQDLQQLLAFILHGHKLPLEGHKLGLRHVYALWAAAFAAALALFCSKACLRLEVLEPLCQQPSLNLCVLLCSQQRLFLSK